MDILSMCIINESKKNEILIISYAYQKAVFYKEYKVKTQNHSAVKTINESSISQNEIKT